MMDYADGLVKAFQLRQKAYDKDFVRFTRDHPFWGNELAIAGKIANVGR